MYFTAIKNGGGHTPTHTKKKKKNPKGQIQENNAVVYSVNTHAAVVCFQNSENRILPRDSLSGKKADV